MKNYLPIFICLFATSICYSQEKKVDSNEKISSDLKTGISNVVLENLKSEKEPDSNLKIIAKKEEEKTSEVIQIETTNLPDSSLKKKQ
jgi:hypothetical protein